MEVVVMEVVVMEVVVMEVEVAIGEECTSLFAGAQLNCLFSREKVSEVEVLATSIRHPKYFQ
jgi:hypothetical protein